jgi:hypothetical protein
VFIRETDALGQTAIPFLIGTKFDTFSTFPRDEQEEITKQVCLPYAFLDTCRSSLLIGEAIRKGNACFPDLLLDIRFNQCSEDLQDRAS